jgi:hypothetical protein
MPDMEDSRMNTPSRVLPIGFFGTAILLSVLAAGAAAQSNTVTSEELARASDVVAVGKVTGMRGEWDQNKTRIVTRVTVAVDEYLKGDAGTVMTITSLGGEVDGVGEWYSHSARFKKDEDVVVFAEKDKDGNYRVAGGQQGKLSIEQDAGTSIARVSEQTTLDDVRTQVKNALKTK